jgi:hypothetical protein
MKIQGSIKLTSQFLVQGRIKIVGKYRGSGQGKSFYCGTKDFIKNFLYDAKDFIKNQKQCFFRVIF